VLLAHPGVAVVAASAHDHVGDPAVPIAVEWAIGLDRLSPLAGDPERT
jgi:hypothetical protein